MADVRVRVPRLRLTGFCRDQSWSESETGSWSNRKTPALQAGDPGAIPGESTDRTIEQHCDNNKVNRHSVVQRRQRPAYTRETTVRVRPE